MDDIHQPTSRNRTGWLSNQGFGEGTKSWDEICKAVNVTYEQTQQVDETAKLVGGRCLKHEDSATNGHSFLMMIKTSRRFRQTGLVCLRLGM